MLIDNDLKASYFNWLCNKVWSFNTMMVLSRYSKLLQTLYLIDYTFDNDMDQNRAYDGLSLRNYYADENQTSEGIIDPCSVLEMMVALAIKCEDIMCDPSKDDRTYYWFEEMLDSLNLTDQDDYNFDQGQVERRISIFLNKQYDANGRGGLFTILNADIDMRTKDIWYQMQAFLCEYDSYNNHCKKIVISSLR